MNGSVTFERKAAFDRGVALRAGIDLFVMASSLGVAFLLRYVFAIVFEAHEVTATELFDAYILYFLLCLPLISSVGLAAFAYFGLYGRARAYKWRQKALAVIKAVSLPYLVVPLALFLVPGTIHLPRSVLGLGWLLTLSATLLARTWSTIWRRMVLQEVSTPLNASGSDGKKVLLIGGAGYIGSALVPKLLDAGYRVRLLDLFLYGKEPLKGVLEHPNLECVTGDFRQVEKVVSAMKGVDSVIHLGGLVGDPACAVDEQLTIEINLVATRVIADVARGEGVRRFVFASTCSVYGASDGILDETSALNPVSLYARSKIASERVLLSASGDGFCPVMLRFGTIFGLSGRTRFDLVVNLLSAKAVFEGKITLYGGDQWRPFVHVDDAAQAVLTALEAPSEKVDGQVFNIGGDELNYTLRQVGELIHQMVPSAQLLDFGANADRRNYRVNFAKVRKRLGFVPRWTLAEGVSQVIESIRSGQVVDYTQPEYSNVKFLSHEKIKVLGKEGGWEKRVLEGAGPSEDAVTRSS